ncbi:hypothetical protein ACIQOW_15200 [Kitasatospora sp. NPDC091335]|uniref:hypothetical protein n=1 Tax=Kitasatospora sp. NPDC091335 TaxID=3364085 RepID=UPI003804E2EA
MTIRRNTALTVTALALALAALTGCGADGAAPAPTAGAIGAPSDATGAFDPAVAVAQRSREPYAVTAEMTVETGEGDEKEVFTSTGRINFSTRTQGSRTEERTVRGAEILTWAETLTADGVVYRRDKAKGGTRWTADPDSGAGMTGDADAAAGFARVLLEAGPTARKGMETEAGVPVFHLGARLSPAQVRGADPWYADRLTSQGVEAIDCQQWIDRYGRLVRGELAMMVDGKPVVSKQHHADFGPAETFTPPAAG